MARLGEMLRAARQDMGVSLAEVEQATRIRRRHLVALEEEDFAALPETIYVIGLLKTYARYLNLDAEQAAEMFRDQSGRHELPGVQPETRILRESARKGGLSPAGVSGLLMVAGLALLLFYGYQQYLQIEASVQPPAAATALATPPPRLSAVPAGTAALALLPTVTATVLPSPTPTPPVGVTVELLIKYAQCWVRVIADDKIVTNNDQMGEMLNPGDTRVWRADNYIHVRVGNAGAADVTVNGVHEGTMGRMGDVIDKEWRAQATPVPSR